MHNPRNRVSTSFRDPLHDHAHIIPRPRGRRDCNQSSRAACRSTRAPWASGWPSRGRGSERPATRAGWSPAAGD